MNRWHVTLRLRWLAMKSVLGSLLGTDGENARPQDEERSLRRRRRRRRGGVAVVGFGVALLLCLWLVLDMCLTAGLPKLDELRAYSPPQTTRVYSDDGHLVGRLYRERRTVVSLKSIPTHVVRAFLAAEDASFFHHHGLDFAGIFRAALKNLRPGARLQGASTITQQTVKTLLVGNERSYARKIREAFLATRLEFLLSKDEILHIYLNQIYFGAGAYGIEEASQTYFNKSASDLSLAEAALLAGIPKHPSRFSPRAHPEAAKKRRDHVLELMKDNGWVTEAEVRRAQLTSIRLADSQGYLGKAPHYVEHVRLLLVDLVGEERAYSGGLRVRTGMLAKQQVAAHQSVQDGLAKLAESKRFRVAGQTDGAHQSGEAQADDSERPLLQAALVAIEPDSRLVRAMVGGSGMRQGGFNRATQARRQPGSAFKPIVYAAGLADRAITPATLCPDAPVVIRDLETGETWKPKNYDSRSFAGMISFRHALMRSINTCSVRIVDRIGHEKVIDMARALGIKAELPEDMTIALGSGDVTPLELANAYATVAAGGLYAEPIFIRSIETPDGEVIYRATAEQRRALEPEAAFVLTSMLHSVVQGGTGARARALGRPLAGKTGTTNESRNVWFSGFSPQLVATVWVGSDNNAPLRGLTGSSGALPLWIDFMGEALEGMPTKDFDVPQKVVYRRIDPRSGLQSDGPDTVYEVFIEGTEPDVQSAVDIDPIFAVDDTGTDML